MTIRLKYMLAVAAIVVIWFICKSIINIEVTKETHKIQDSYQKRIADLKIQLETDKIELEKNMKNEIITAKTDLEKCKLDIETEKNKKRYFEMSKKNPKDFKKELNKTLGVKEKKK